jgi:hypothetical protein
MDFHKTENIKTESQLENLILHHIEFIETGEGKPARFYNEFKHLIDGNIVSDFTWIDKTEREIEAEETKAQAEIDLIESYKADVEKWRNEVIKPWSMGKLHEWIDMTYIQPLKYALTPTQETEREEKRIEILEYHNQTIYVADPVKPEPPSYI